MPALTIGCGAILILLGVSFFVGTGSEHKTALIPAFAGIVFVLLGALGFKDGLRKHVMHAAAALGLLGFLAGTGMGFPKLIKHFSSGEPANAAPKGPLEQSLMGLICLVFVILCVRSFIAARRARRQAEGSPS